MAHRVEVVERRLTLGDVRAALEVVRAEPH